MKHTRRGPVILVYRLEIMCAMHVTEIKLIRFCG